MLTCGEKYDDKYLYVIKPISIKKTETTQAHKIDKGLFTNTPYNDWFPYQLVPQIPLLFRKYEITTPIIPPIIINKSLNCRFRRKKNMPSEKNKTGRNHRVPIPLSVNILIIVSIKVSSNIVLRLNKSRIILESI
jgi:hypothetical protein